MNGFLITEQSLEINLYENKREKSFYIEGIFQVADKPNSNGRTYPRAILERECRRINEEIQKDIPCWGTLNHPANTWETDLSKVSHRLISLKMKKNGIMEGKAKLLDTDCGRQALTLLKESNKIGVSSRGVGNVGKNGIVENSFRLITFDIVDTPSVQGAWANGIMENYTIDLKLFGNQEDAISKRKLAEAKQMKKWLDEYRNQLKEY